MTVMLPPRKNWARGIGWAWAVAVILGIIVALVDGVSR
jgi:hypothetical protein